MSLLARPAVDASYLVRTAEQVSSGTLTPTLILSVDEALVRQEEVAVHRQPLLEMLCQYERVFPCEAEMVRRIRWFVEGNAQCFDRSHRPGHITAGAWIVSENRQRVLLTHHRKLGSWLQLGGHADGHCELEQVALKEAREESGMHEFDLVALDGELMPFDMDVHDIPNRCDDDGNVLEEGHEHFDIRFLMVAREPQEIHVSDESYQVNWFTPTEVLNLTSEESVLRMLSKGCELMS